MLEHVHIQNYRSFVDASAKLSPFTLVIGANASGKTNFLRLFRDLNRGTSGGGYALDNGGHPSNGRHLMPHQSRPGHPIEIDLDFDDFPPVRCRGSDIIGDVLPWPVGSLEIFAIEPDKVSAPEEIFENPFVEGDGTGTARVYDMLKTGVRDELADQIQKTVIQFIPEITRIGVRLVAKGIKEIEARERGMDGPTEGRYLSAGTRILLALITIVHQPAPPPLLLIEDIDHAIHPRLFEDFVNFLRRMCGERGIQIIATTHNPYLLDCFQEDFDSVLLVEKVNGASTITSVGDQVTNLRHHGAPLSMSLSDLYLSGALKKVL